ncbi:hypothetical protein ACN20G_29365 (plasmid) [Streptomyces sp. BI20]|uniref:hypothetical protein n=1 Tax=Streptomyces sp. BI20 TaxID=3403460 RepID=UPI003C71E1C6
MAEPAPARRAFRRALGCALLLGLGPVGCSRAPATWDGGPAPSVSAPVAATPLWPGRTPPTLPADPPAPRALPDVDLPANGLRGVSPALLLRADPGVPGSVKNGLDRCPGSRCRLLPPAFADLTGRGVPELVLAFDDEGRTWLWVYTVSDGSVVRILDYVGQPGLTASAAGRELVIGEAEGARVSTVRFRWNGHVLAPARAG